MTKVKLRTKPMTGERKSLYLDFYPPIIHPQTGKPTRREFLGLYVFDKPKNPPDKDHNRHIMGLAENIRSQRQVQLAKEDYSFLVSKPKAQDFLAYYRKWMYKFEGNYLESCQTVLRYLELFTNGELSTDKIDETFCMGFREFLLTTNGIKRSGKKLSQNTAATFFGLFKSVLRQAYKEDVLVVNLAEKVPHIKHSDVQREYLSLEELQQLANTECEVPVLKRAAIFSALTGLRYSDIEKLVWDEVRHSEGEGHYIRFRQKKTAGAEILPISDQAFGLLGERGESTDKVFAGLKYDSHQNERLRYWLAIAGIRKKITFHCFRHTYATLQLSLGTDIYTVSKMLGHRDLSTTQIYAKIVDKAKREAANKIKLDL